MAEECTICGEEGTAEQELQCTQCTGLVHFLCALGVPINNPKNRTLLSKGQYRCPVCVVSTNNRLVIKVVSANQVHLSQDVGQRFTPERLHNQADVVADELEEEVVDPTHAHERGRDTPHTVADLKPEDLARAGKPKYILSRLRNLPDHTNTVVIGDSNTHGIDGKQVDPTKHSVAVRSSGGLCIPAFVHALKAHADPCYRIKRLYLSLGTNDSLHEGDHCSEDWPHHIKALQVECLRVFPKARLHFILPFKGITGVSITFIKDLEKLLKELCPKFKRHHPPSMYKKVVAGGVHINRDGKASYLSFLQRQLLGNKPAQKPDMPNVKTPTDAGHKTVRAQPLESFRVQPQESFRVQSVSPVQGSPLSAGTTKDTQCAPQHVTSPLCGPAPGIQYPPWVPYGVQPYMVQRPPPVIWPPAADPRLYSQVNLPQQPDVYREMEAAYNTRRFNQRQPPGYIY